MSSFTLAKPAPNPSYKHISGAGTTVVKTGPGVLQTVVFGTTATGTATFYDNTAGSGTVIAVVTLAAGNPVALNFGLQFAVGLTVVVVGANDLTVTFA